MQSVYWFCFAVGGVFVALSMLGGGELFGDGDADFDAELDAALGAEDAGVAEAGAASREASVEAAGQDLASEQVRQNYLVATIVCCNLLLMFDAHLVQFIGGWLA